MKLLLKTFFVLLISLLMVAKSDALSFSEGYEQTSNKPMILLVYANWASNYQTYVGVMDALEKEYGQKFNFVKLDIAKSDAAAFNARFHIYPNLPYILMYRDGGKVSRYIQRSCANDYSCVESKMKTFLY